MAIRLISDFEHGLDAVIKLREALDDSAAIVGMTSSPPGLALFDLHTRQYRRVLQVPEGTDPGWNTWSHDSRYVYFLLDGLMRVPISGGDTEQVLDLSDFQFGGRMGMWFGLDPRDAPILIRDRGTQEIYALTLNGNSQQQNSRSPTP